MATGWKIRCSNLGRGKRFFSSPKRLDRLWGPYSLLFNRYWRSLKLGKWLGRKIYHLFSLVARLRMSGALLCSALRLYLNLYLLPRFSPCLYFSLPYFLNLFFVSSFVFFLSLSVSQSIPTQFSILNVPLISTPINIHFQG